MDGLRRAAVLLVVVTLVAGLVSAREQALSQKVSRRLELASVEIAGKVTYPNGRTPVALAPVRVWSVSAAQFAHQTVTDKDGAYRLPALAPGSYQLVFADRVRLELLVAEKEGAQAAALDVVIPRGKAVFAQMPMDRQAAILMALSIPTAGTEPPPDEGGGLLPALVIGGGSLTAVGAVANSQGWFDGNRRSVNSP